jgi:secreted Zn-dependent insulinase-like peptidase
MSLEKFRDNQIFGITTTIFFRSLLTLALKLANPDSRDKGFTVGSRETLNVTDIYEQVADFHDRYYSANLMTLVIVANDTLDR